VQAGDVKGVAPEGLQGAVGILQGPPGGQELDRVAHPVVDEHRVVAQLRGFGLDGAAEGHLRRGGQIGHIGGGAGRRRDVEADAGDRGAGLGQQHFLVGVQALVPGGLAAGRLSGGGPGRTPGQFAGVERAAGAGCRVLLKELADGAEVLLVGLGLPGAQALAQGLGADAQLGFGLIVAGQDLGADLLLDQVGAAGVEFVQRHVGVGVNGVHERAQLLLFAGLPRGTLDGEGAGARCSHRLGERAHEAVGQGQVARNAFAGRGRPARSGGLARPIALLRRAQALYLCLICRRNGHGPLLRQSAQRQQGMAQEGADQQARNRAQPGVPGRQGVVRVHGGGSIRGSCPARRRSAPGSGAAPHRAGLAWVGAVATAGNAALGQARADRVGGSQGGAGQ